jgi:NAD(P)-dependent dehydrogenase (short-subunit alcohol dehydrogenase family)
VVVSSRSQAAVSRTVDELKNQGYRASGLVCDVSVPSDLERLLEHAIQSWGRIHVWVNNAGLSGGLRRVEELSQEEIAALVGVNVLGTMQACRLVIPYFLEQGGGILINLSGKGGRGEVSPHTAVYAATKAAVTSLTRSLAAENKGKPLSIHAVIPGMVATDFFRHAKTSPQLADIGRSVPLVLNALGVPLDVVGRSFVPIAAQVPGQVTGKVYNVLAGRRLLRGMVLLAWYRVTGRLA